VNKLSSLLGGLAVLAIAIVFIFSFQPGGGANQVASDAPDCAAEVRGSCIRAAHFTASYRLLAPRNADAARLRSMRLKTQTIDGLIERQLLADDGRRLGLGVSEEDLSRELATGRFRVSLPAEKVRQYGYALGLAEDGVRVIPVNDKKSGTFDPKVYEKQVRTMAHMAPPDFRDYQREEILAARVRDLVRSRARVGENEARAQFSREKSTATLSYVRFRRGWFADEVIDASDEAVAAWETKNKDEVEKVWSGRKAQLTPECRSVQHILRKIDPESTVPLEEQEKAARAAIEDARKRAQGGEDFAKLAAEVSEAPSASRGGDEGCVLKGRLPKPIEDAIFGMAKEGDLTDVVETKQGLHLIRLAKLATGAEAETLGRRQVAREIYLANETERLAAEAAKAVRASAAAGKTMDEALAAWRATLPTRAAATNQGAGPRGDDKKKKEKEKKEGDDAKEEAAAPVKRHHDEPVVETTMPFGETGDPIDGLKPGQNAAAIAFSLDKPGSVPGDVLALEDGYAVIALKEKKIASDEEWKEQRDFYLSAMRGAKQQDALVGYVRRLREAAKEEIKVNTAFTKESTAKPGEGEDEGEAPVDE
jgi:peptidyl-prolyl cis-trans isomerase D